ncbi:MAG: radical SAM protein [Candidatus Zixiibacteriota bacterium]
MTYAGTYRNSANAVFSYLSKRLVYCCWQVTYRCNFRCSFCEYWRMNAPQEDEISVSDFATAARKLRAIGSMFISLAGGEPLIRADLPEIASAISAYHLPFITTNGWFVTQEKAKNLFKAGLFGAAVSLDFADEKKHDHHRGKEGAFKRAVAAVKHLVEAKTSKFQKVNVTAVLLQENVDDMEKLAILAGKLGAEFTVQPYAAVKRNGMHSQTTGEPVMNAEVSAHLLKLKRKHRHFKSSPEYLRRFDQFFQEGIDGCQAGKLFFNIDQKGDVAKCVEDLKNPVGNIKTSGVEELKSALLQKQLQNRCQACWYGCRGEVESLYTWRGIQNTFLRIVSPTGHTNGSGFRQETHN